MTAASLEGANSMMHAFPPPPEGQVTLANWRTAPFSHWGFSHVRELIPSAEIKNDPRSVRPLPEAPTALPSLDRIAEPCNALLVLHRGRIVAERYADGMTAGTPHILMSVSKSMLGLLAGILAESGCLDTGAPVTEHVPEVSNTAYRGATVRQLLDMRAGILFDEDYMAGDGPIVDYRRATGWNPLEPGEPPSDLRSFLAQLAGADGSHGQRFHYVSPNTDLLAWVIERAAGERYADLMGRLLWAPAGAGWPAYITVDRLGAPRAAGGMCVTARDLARIGQLIVENGRRDGRQVLPERWIDDIESNGDPEAWEAGEFSSFFPGRRMHYRSQCYVLRGKNPLIFGIGIHGQNLYVDRYAEVVMVRLCSRPLPIEPELISRGLEDALAVRDFLAAA